ncbi:bile salt-activated lipase-like isoform X2 [Macrobrachium rosenbergii]|uniref:bile salt-activated lipase-like isoform X2 n=1 Tax=Macrobrachium rosenbergii TaxID=79674 RepID=UPI0034D5FCA9
MRSMYFLQNTCRGALLAGACLLLLDGGFRGASSMESEEPVVLDTPSGRIRGEKYLLADGTRGLRFLGIPYAKPPVGNLRFAAPVEYGSWKGILEAREFGAVCYQPLETDVWDTMESNVDLGHLEDQLKRALVAELGTDLYEEQVEELHDELRMVVEKTQKARKSKREEGCGGEMAGAEGKDCQKSGKEKVDPETPGVYRTSRPPWGTLGESSSVRINSFNNSHKDSSRSHINKSDISASRTHSNNGDATTDETHFKHRPNSTILLQRLKHIIQAGDDSTQNKHEISATSDSETATGSWDEAKLADDSSTLGWINVREYHGKHSAEAEQVSGKQAEGGSNHRRRGAKEQRKKYLYMQQKHIREYDMSEDCLTLNVYMPILEGPQKTGFEMGGETEEPAEYPVIVYIHGGSFYANGGRLYPGEKLATKGIVVVTINYRLGPFGFLSTGDQWAPGNWGLLDQRLAVQWVQRHAHAFKGRKDKILLVGNSAGGASVILHLISPLSRGLFSRAAALSGCAMAPWALQASPQRFAKKLAQDVGCPKAPIPDLLACLRRTDAMTINQAYAEKNIQDGLDLAFAPVVEGEVSGAFLPRSPKALVEEGDIARIPLIMTLTRDEVSMWLRHKQDNISLLEAEKWIDYLMRQKYPDLEPLPLAAVLHAVRASYLYRYGYEAKDAPQPMVPIKTISELMSDLGLRVPCIEEAGLLSKWTNLYFGEFSYSSSDDIRIGEQKWIGSYHESDLQFLFGQPYLGLENTLRMPEDRAVADILMDLLLAFAHTGVPELNEVEWPEYNQSHLVHLEMSERLSLNHNLVQHRLCFWQQFIPLMTNWPMKPLDVNFASPQGVALVKCHLGSVRCPCPGRCAQRAFLAAVLEKANTPYRRPGSQFDTNKLFQMHGNLILKHNNPQATIISHRCNTDYDDSN